ncbi:MAG: nucleotidyltransferase domain-containing protein [Oscillatoria sp. SIO1A7]|nr:nucleotidyltransferase domain-containing protein [Oscillatoria sp. SIO1A7]
MQEWALTALIQIWQAIEQKAVSVLVYGSQVRGHDREESDLDLIAFDRDCYDKILSVAESWQATNPPRIVSVQLCDRQVYETNIRPFWRTLRREGKFVEQIVPPQLE